VTFSYVCYSLARDEAQAAFFSIELKNFWELTFEAEGIFVDLSEHFMPTAPFRTEATFGGHALHQRMQHMNHTRWPHMGHLRSQMQASHARIGQDQ
jgi:hypothetical protein